MTAEMIRGSFVRRSRGFDLAVIEGNRGLYDGVNAAGTYSTAELAKELGAPVLLILDTTKMTRTAAAVVLGCQKLDPELRLAGVVLNRVGRVRQERLIREAVEKICGIPVLGAIPRLSQNPFPERHMGLTPSEEHRAVETAVARAAELAETYLDLERIREIAARVPAVEVETTEASEPPAAAAGLRIGVMRDSAFQFYYPENLEALERRGAGIVTVSPVADGGLPRLDALYVGGGFPETHAAALADNAPFRRSLRSAVEDGLPVYAECGGLMYLGTSLRAWGRRYPMAGVLPIELELHEKPRGHGYTDLVVDRANPFFPEGTRLRGHEFHYSALTGDSGRGLETAFRLEKGRGIGGGRDGIVQGNVLAAYTHLHGLATPAWADGLIAAARRHRRSGD